MNKTLTEILTEERDTYTNRLRNWIANETDPKSVANMQANLAGYEARTEAELSGKYVGTGSAQADGAYVEFCKYFATKEEALAECARFPKFVGVKQGSMSFGNGNVIFSARMRVSFCSGKTTGASNETGIKRTKRFLAIAGDYVWHHDYISNPLSHEAFNAAIGK